MKYFVPFSVLRPQPLCVCIFSLFFLTLLWASCNKVTHDDLTLDFPQKFTLSELVDKNTRLYRLKEDGNLPELTKEEAGTFTSFLDTMAGYTELSNTRLNFTGIELLDASRVRIFSDGSLGIPAFDTIVGYSQSGQSVIKIITANWTLLDAPLILTLGNSNGQYLSLSPVWFYHTYRPFIPPFELKYSPIRVMYSSHYGALRDLVDFLHTDFEYGSDFSTGDTLALHWGIINFR